MRRNRIWKETGSGATLYAVVIGYTVCAMLSISLPNPTLLRGRADKFQLELTQLRVRLSLDSTQPVCGGVVGSAVGGTVARSEIRRGSATGTPPCLVVPASKLLLFC
jgi:hypothetical protein